VGRESGIYRYRLTIPVFFGCLFVLSACTSTETSSTDHASSSTAPPTTSQHSEALPAPPNASSIAAFLNTPNNALIEFERITTPLDSGSIPSQATCQSLERQLDPNSVAAPTTVLGVVKRIKDTAIQFAATQDLQDKVTLLSACSEGRATTKMAALAGSADALVKQELRQLGVTG
jgi:hypothetical protein